MFIHIATPCVIFRGEEGWQTDGSVCLSFFVSKFQIGFRSMPTSRSSWYQWIQTETKLEQDSIASLNSRIMNKTQSPGTSMHADTHGDTEVLIKLIGSDFAGKVQRCEKTYSKQSSQPKHDQGTQAMQKGQRRAHKR